MVAWNAYKRTEEFANSMRWLDKSEHRQGSMWAAFLEGFLEGFNAAIKPKGDGGEGEGT